MKSAQPESRHQRRILRRRGCLAGLGLAGGLVLCEILARLLLPLPHGYFLQPPNTRKVFPMPAAMLADVPDVARHVTNDQGIRGDPLGPDQGYRILAIGGSTTACTVLDAPQTWPSQLQARLSQRHPQFRVWVGNVGKDGLNTRHHLVTMSRFVPQLPKMDAVIFMVGINDFVGRLAQDDQYQALTPAQIENDSTVLARTFTMTPPEAGLLRWHQRLGLGRLAARVRDVYRVLTATKPAQALAEARAARRNATTLRTALPALGPALREYEQNLEALIQRGRARGIRMIFVTQPFLWKARQPPAEENVLMFGFVGPSLSAAKVYYAPAALAEGMAQYNAAMLRVCRQSGVECIDLAGRFPADLTLLYDDCHFNRGGAAKVAQALADYFESAPPFAAVPEPTGQRSERH